MAGGVVYELNTWSAKRIIGDSSASAAAQALLQTGEDVATDIWILNRTNRASLYGIKYKYDDSTNGTEDKIELYGGYTANAPTAWVQLDTGDLYILGNVGIGHAPETYKLYVNGTSYLGGNTTIQGNILPSATRTYNIGSDSLMWNDAHMRGIGVRHIDAATQTYITDGQLHIGYGSVAPTKAIYLYYSANTSSRTKFFEVNSNGAYALTRFGVNGQSTDQTLYVNGTGYFTGSVTIVKATPELVLNNTNAATYSIIRLNTPASNSAGIIFMNGASRTDDGGANLMTIRNNVGDLRLDDNTAVTGVLTVGVRNTTTAPSAITSVDRIIITPYYHTGGPWKITSRDDASNAYLSLYYNTTETMRMQHNGSVLFCNNISFTNSGTAFRGINYGTMGDNDQWRIGGAATGSNAGYMELATADDGDEPIYVRQYTGVFSTVKRTLTLLDANGYSYFPSYINIGGHEKNASSPSYVWGSNSSDNFLRSYQTAYLNVNSASYLRSRGNITCETGTTRPAVSGVSMSQVYNNGYPTTYGNALTLNGRGCGQLLIGWSGTSGARADAFLRSKRDTSDANWSSWYTILDSGNYTSYTVTKTGSGASGTWGISITDNANTANYQNCVATNEIRYARNGNMASAQSLWQGWSFAEGRVAVINDWRFGNGNGGLAPIYGSKVYNAVWNDFAEYRESDETEGGRVLVSNGSGKLVRSTERLQPAARVISDTFGCSVGQSDTARTPIGVAGRVLVFPYQNRENYKVGDAVCAAPNGTADIMTREEIIQYPDRIIGIVDEIPQYEIWDQIFTNKKDDGEIGEQNHTATPVNGRIWIYVR